MEWMNTTDKTDYSDVFTYVKKIFKEVSDESYGGNYELAINETNGNPDYQQVYNLMKQGQFDLGFGSISGNSLNPLNFLEVLKSDNSSTFTLNWTGVQIPIKSALVSTLAMTKRRTLSFMMARPGPSMAYGLLLIRVLS